MKKIKLTTVGMCDRCANRRDCQHRKSGPYEMSCHRPKGKQDFGYKLDRKVVERTKAINKVEIERFLSKLTVTDLSQVTITRENNIFYRPKDNEVRRANSRDGFCDLKEGSVDEFVKYCENCGEMFETVNESRRLCDKCHDEICEYLGVNYSRMITFEGKQPQGVGIEDSMSDSECEGII